MKTYPIIYKFLLLLSLLTSLNLAAAECDFNEPHVPAAHINNLTKTMLSQPLINEVYDQISRNWQDIPTLNEAKTWYTGVKNIVLPEDTPGVYKYYTMKVGHYRYKPFSSSFCGLQEAVKVSLPKANSTMHRYVDIMGVQYSTPYFKTKLGIVSQFNIINNEKKTNNLAFSVDGFQEIYDKYAKSRGWEPRKFAKVELITGAKRPGVSRWAIISVYLAYETEESPDPVLYAIEAATANGALPNPTKMPGQAGSTFYFAPSLGKPICSNPREPNRDEGCETGYAFTPYSSSRNVYKASFNKVNNSSNPLIKYYLGLSTYRPLGLGGGLEQQPYFSLSTNFYEWVPTSIHNTTALHIEALLRVLALSSVEGFDIMPPERLAPQKLLSDPFNSILSGLKGTLQPMLNSVLGILGSGFKNQLPWISKPVTPGGGSKVVAQWISSNNLNYAPQTLPRDSVNGKNVIFVAYESDKSGTSLFQYSATPPRWIEYSPHNVYGFVETHRDEWSVYLNDPKRNVKLRIDLFKRKIMYSDNNKTTKEIPLYNVSYAGRQHTVPTQSQQTLQAQAQETAAQVLQAKASAQFASFSNQSVNGCNAVYAESKEGMFFKSGNSSWVQADGKTVKNFNEVNRDEWSVYLENQASRVQIDLFKKQMTTNEKSTGRNYSSQVTESKRDPARPAKAFDGPGYVSGLTAVDTRKSPNGTLPLQRSPNIIGGNGANKDQYFWTGGFEEVKQTNKQVVVLYNRKGNYWWEFNLATNVWTYIAPDKKTRIKVGALKDVKRSCDSRM